MDFHDIEDANGWKATDKEQYLNDMKARGKRRNLTCKKPYQRQCRCHTQESERVVWAAEDIDPTNTTLKVQGRREDVHVSS